MGNTRVRTTYSDSILYVVVCVYVVTDNDVNGCVQDKAWRL